MNHFWQLFARPLLFQIRLLRPRPIQFPFRVLSFLWPSAVGRVIHIGNLRLNESESHNWANLCRTMHQFFYKYHVFQSRHDTNRCFWKCEKKFPSERFIFAEVASTEHFILFRRGIGNLDAAMWANRLSAVKASLLMCHIQQNPEAERLAAQAVNVETRKKAKTEITQFSCDVDDFTCSF